MKKSGFPFHDSQFHYIVILILSFFFISSPCLYFELSYTFKSVFITNGQGMGKEGLSWIAD